jgi:hypothetical protein
MSIASWIFIPLLVCGAAAWAVVRVAAAFDVAEDSPSSSSNADAVHPDAQSGRATFPNSARRGNKLVPQRFWRCRSGLP